MKEQAERCKKCLWHISLLKKYTEKYNFVRPTSLPRFHYSLGYRIPAEVTYKYATVNGDGTKNYEAVDRSILVI
ncbi:MAG: hypothetical protein RXR65_00815 [Hydrogenobaculum sp.]